MMFSLAHLRRQPAGNPLIVQRSASSQTIHSYGDVVECVEFVLRLLERRRIPHQCGVAILMEANHVSAPGCVLLLSILNHQCRFCSLDEAADRSRLDATGASFLVADTGSAHRTFDTELMEQFRVFGQDFFLSEISESGAAEPSLRAVRNWCYTIGTTGSTGAARTVHVPYECIMPNVLALSERLEISSKDTVLLGSPLTFDPFVIELLLAVRNGAALLIATSDLRLARAKLLQLAFPSETAQRGVTIMQMTPSLFRSFGADAIRHVILSNESSLRVLMLGGESFPNISEVMSWLPKHPLNGQIQTNKRIFNIYGITEVSCWSTMHECHFTSSSECGNVPIGGVIDTQTKLSILRENGEVLEGVGQGELLIGSASRKCYIPQVDKGETHPHGVVLYRATGDLVERNECGAIFYHGRLNNTVKRFGKRLSLDAVSKKIEESLHERSTSVVCLWSELRRELICCLPHREPLKEQTSRFMERLADYEKPDAIVAIDSFPLNRHGKVDRLKLLQSIESSRAHCSPVETLQRFLRDTLNLVVEEQSDAWSTKSTPPHKKRKNMLACAFLAVGGTSFQALSLASDIGERLASGADQRKLLEMLLNPAETLANVFNLLQTAKIATHTNSRVTYPRDATTPRQLIVRWRVNFDKCIDSAPMCAFGKYICVGSHSHLLLTIDAASGAEVMRLNLPDRIECQVELVQKMGHLAVVGCYDGLLYAFDLLLGGIVWKFNAGGMIKAKALFVAAADCVVVACYAQDFNLSCLCLTTQKVRWRQKLGAKGIFAAPILSVRLSRIFVCTLDGTYACIDVATGAVVWSGQLRTPIFATPALALDDALLVVAEVSGQVHVCCAQSGEILVTYVAAGNIFSSITVLATASNALSLYVGCHDHSVYCLAYKQAGIRELSLLWKVDLKAPVYATPVLMQKGEEQFIVGASTNGLLVVLDAATGHLLASHDVGAAVFSTPCCLADEMSIYVGCRDNYLYSLQLSPG